MWGVQTLVGTILIFGGISPPPPAQNPAVCVKVGRSEAGPVYTLSVISSQFSGCNVFQIRRLCPCKSNSQLTFSEFICHLKSLQITCR